ncbi:MAG: hypothetical protein CMH60_06355 [Myxococcales bacterium]|nr:hypothetical protein [Myxococcales bacterium]
MQVLCPKCSTEYVLDATKIPAQGALLPCATCGEKIQVLPPQAESTETPEVEDFPPLPDNPFADLNLGESPETESPQTDNTPPAFLDSIPLDGTEQSEDTVSSIEETTSDAAANDELATDDFSSLDLNFEPLSLNDAPPPATSENAPEPEIEPSLDINSMELADTSADMTPSLNLSPEDDPFAQLSLDEPPAATPALTEDDPFAALDSEVVSEETTAPGEDDPFAALDSEVVSGETTAPQEDDPFAQLDLNESPMGNSAPGDGGAPEDNDPFAELDLGEASPQKAAPAEDDPFAELDLGEQSAQEAAPAEDDPFAELDLGEQSAQEAAPAEDDPFAQLDLSDSSTSDAAPAEDDPFAQVEDGSVGTEDAAPTADDPFAQLDLGETESPEAAKDPELDPFAGYEKPSTDGETFEVAQEDEFANLNLDADILAEDAQESPDETTGDNPEENQRRPTLTSLPDAFGEGLDVPDFADDQEQLEGTAPASNESSPENITAMQNEDESLLSALDAEAGHAEETPSQDAQIEEPVHETDDDLPTVFAEEHDEDGEAIHVGSVETGVNAALTAAFGDDADMESLEAMSPPSRYSPQALLSAFQAQSKPIQGAIGGGLVLVLLVVGYGAFSVLQSEPKKLQTIPQTAQAPKPEKTQVAPEDKKEEKAKFKKPNLPILTQQSVYYLGYNALKLRSAELEQSSIAKNSKPTPMVLWAWLRLAHVFKEDSAKRKLLSALRQKPKIKDKDMAAALSYSYLALTGKSTKAIIKAKVKLKKSKLEDSPHVAFVLSQIYLGKKKNAAAFKLLSSLLKRPSPWLDVQIQSIEQLAQFDSDSREMISELIDKLLSTKPSADTLARLASFALRHKRYALAERTLGRLNITENHLEIAADHREKAFKHSTNFAIRMGQILRGLEIAKLWTETHPKSISAAIITSRLLNDLRLGQSFLMDLFETASSRQEKSHIVSEQIKIELKKGKKDQARNIFETHRSSLTKPWRYFLESKVSDKISTAKDEKKLLEQALKLQPTLVEARLRLIQLEPDRSIRNEKLLKLNKNFSDPLVKHALLKAKSLIEDPKEKRALLNSILWKEPTLTHPIRLLVDWSILLAEKDTPQGVNEILQGLQKDFPKNPLPLLARAKIAESQTKIDEAVKHYKAMIALAPKVEKWHMNLASLLLRNDRRLEALNVVEKLFSDHPQARNASTLLTLSQALAERDRVQAKIYLRESLRLKPTPDGFSLLANFNLQEKNFREARNNFREAYNLAPKHIPTIYALASAEFQQQNLGETLKLLKKLLVLDSKHYWAWELLADSYREQGNISEALITYNKAAEFSEDKSSIYMKIARLELQELNRIQSAMKTLKKAIEADNQNADAYYYLGYAQKDLGRWQDASASLKMYLKLKPKSGFALEVKQDIADLENRDVESERPF